MAFLGRVGERLPLQGSQRIRPNARRFDDPLVFGREVVWTRLAAVTGSSSSLLVEEEAVGVQTGCSRCRHWGRNLAARATVDGATHGQPAQIDMSSCPNHMRWLRPLPTASRTAAMMFDLYLRLRSRAFPVYVCQGWGQLGD